MRTTCLAALLVLAGCKEAAPTLVGGKSASHWVAALGSADPAARKTAAFKLGNAGAIDPAVLPALTAALHDDDATVRLEAIVALAKIGPQAREAAGALENLRHNDPVEQVRATAARGLEALGRQR